MAEAKMLLKGRIRMPKTVVRENESIDDALRRFKRQVNKAGNLADLLQVAKRWDIMVATGRKRVARW